jgi:PKD repeat protein/lysophospholipase L1-like esterase
MRASRARRVTLSLIFALTPVLVTAPVLAAGPALPLPDTMAAVGDSITQAASTAGSLGADAPQNSWATGTSATVNSHYLRLLAAGAPIGAQNHNRSVSGAKMGGLQAQMATLSDLDPDYLTVLIGGNDVCTPTEAQMTSVADFRAGFQAAMATLRAVSPETHVYVVSIPRVMGLYELFRNNFWARFIWSLGGVCQSLLANPTSTNQADVDRRARVDQRNRDFNAVLAEVCASAAAQPCLWDGGAAFSTAFASSDVSGDYFHPSVAGQAKLAAVSWANGYTWIAAPPPNQLPSASFTSSCTGLSCSFTNTSTDADGTMTHAWSFGDGTGSTAVSPSHTYTAGGTYTVTLTVTDDDLATDSAAASFTLTEPPPNQAPVASFTPSCAGLACTFTNTSTDADGTMTHAWSFGDGTGSTAVSPSKTYGAGGTYTVGLTVTDDDGAVSATSQSVTVSAPTMRIQGLTASATNINSKSWRATVTITVRDGAGAAVPSAVVSGSWTAGAPDTCTTGSAGTCTATSDNLNRRNLPSVTFNVTGVTRAGYTYTPTANVVSSIVVQRPQ